MNNYCPIDRSLQNSGHVTKNDQHKEFKFDKSGIAT